MSSSIEIVVHCYDPPGVELYSQMLRWQWSSLVTHSCRGRVKWTVCFTADDRSTADVLFQISDEARAAFVDRPDDPVGKLISLRPGELFRRAIGRNSAALASESDVVFFTDCDYLFGEGCLDAILDAVEPSSGLTIPMGTLICRDHATGDRLIRAGRYQDQPSADFDDRELFVPRRQKLAIGGVQIVGGDLARRIGYLNGTKWVKPVDPAAGFRSCRCDKVWRKRNKLQAVRVLIPNMLRLRHTIAGRDVDGDGNHKGKEVW